MKKIPKVDRKNIQVYLYQAVAGTRFTLTNRWPIKGNDSTIEIQGEDGKLFCLEILPENKFRISCSQENEMLKIIDNNDGSYTV